MFKLEIGDEIKYKGTELKYTIVELDGNYVKLKSIKNSDEVSVYFSITLECLNKYYEKFNYNLLEMLKSANIDNETYKANDLCLYYDNKNGFYDGDDREYESLIYKKLNYFIATTTWEKLSKRKMTLKEIEKELGYKIELIND